MPHLTYRIATSQDIPLVASLVNAAYRGEISKMGWTTEAYILGGQRTDADEITKLITAKDSLILLCYRNDEAIGTAHIKRLDDGAYLGMFTVKPHVQGQGIGKQFLQTVENKAREQWGLSKLTISVITLRHELIAFYERRGYRRTGIFGKFPQDPRFGIPKVENLQFEYLEKQLG